MFIHFVSKDVCVCVCGYKPWAVANLAGGSHLEGKWLENLGLIVSGKEARGLFFKMIGIIDSLCSVKTAMLIIYSTSMSDVLLLL